MWVIVLLILSATSLYADAQQNAKELSVATDRWPARKLELVRALAAEAIDQRDAQRWASTQAIADARWARTSGYFLTALGHARRDEAPGVTLARSHAAVANGDLAMATLDRMLVRVHEKLP